MKPFLYEKIQSTLKMVYIVKKHSIQLYYASMHIYLSKRKLKKTNQDIDNNVMHYNEKSFNPSLISTSTTL